VRASIPTHRRPTNSTACLPGWLAGWLARLAPQTKSFLVCLQAGLVHDPGRPMSACLPVCLSVCPALPARLDGWIHCVHFNRERRDGVPGRAAWLAGWLHGVCRLNRPTTAYVSMICLSIAILSHGLALFTFFPHRHTGLERKGWAAQVCQGKVVDKIDSIRCHRWVRLCVCLHHTTPHHITWHTCM